MASISKRVSGAWQNTSYGIRATAMDTITTLPTTIYADGTNATVGIKGNTVQNGTPTPDKPIIPQGCGELEAGQYKIPISSASTTTSVYLGEVGTTRKIRKLVFDGTENWYAAVSSTGLFGIQRFEPMQAQPFIPGYSAISNCYVYNPVQSGIDVATVSGEFVLQAFRAGNAWQYNVFIKDGRYKGLTAWESYLAAQYAAGTPVTVWYVLATEETAVVNEPLMKIDGYADEVNNISIPTTDGVNTLSVDTTVQPSEVEVNYHGWHMGTAHERNSGQWD